MSKKTAFSVQLDEHTAKGDPKSMKYDKGGYRPSSWDGEFFKVPKTGLYVFSVSYLRDSHVPANGGPAGTKDDTHVMILADGASIGFAWAAETSSARQAAWATVIVPLKKGTHVSTEDWADSGKFRRFLHCTFSGFRLGGL